MAKFYSYFITFDDFNKIFTFLKSYDPEKQAVLESKSNNFNILKQKYKMQQKELDSLNLDVVDLKSKLKNSDKEKDSPLTKNR